VYEDLVFAGMLKDAGLMDQRDFDTYISLFNNMANFMRKPNLIVHLDVSPEEALSRIRSRSRDCESGITIEYLRDLHAAYDKFLREIGRAIPVLRVTYEKFATPERMAEVIRREYETMLNIRTVDPNITV
jgi:deoxyadenosine kinase